MLHDVPLTHKAAYRAERNPQYINNPLIEAMPEFLEEDEFNQNVRQSGSLPPDLYSLPTVDALDEIDRLRDVFYPTGLTHQLYEHIYVQMRRAYGPRSPLSAEYRRLMNQLSKQLKRTASDDELKSLAQCQTIAPTILVSGEPGIGKSGTIKRTLRLFKQVIKHEAYGGYALNSVQVVWLSFDMQASAAKKDFARNFFRELDRVTGENTTKEFLKVKSTHEEMQNAMWLAAMKYNIGIIHIDEVQFALNRNKHAKDTPSFPELEALFNKIGVPLILSTTEDALARFEKLPQEAETQQSAGQTSRRLSSVAHLKFRQWTLADPQTKAFFDAYFPAALFDAYPGINNDFKKTVMILCAGIPDAASQLAIAFIRNWYKLAKQGKKFECDKLLAKMYEVRLSVWNAPLTKLRASYNVGTWPTKSESQAHTELTENEPEQEMWEEITEIKPAFQRRPRTTKHQHKAATKVERIDEGAEIIDAESIIISYGQGQCDV
jgi:hypothetical protein